MTIAQMELLHDVVHEGMAENLKAAVIALREGKTILMLDAHERENEGDLIVAAEKITPSSMNFLIKQGSGVVCLALPKNRLDHLGLPLMIPENANFYQTAFTVSIEARFGVTTGVSAEDRAHTIQVAMADDAKSSDLARPGHVFPLAAASRGVFSRMGHTEGSVDLMQIAGLRPGAVLCELMNEDGSMTVGEDRVRFAHHHSMPVVSVEEILFYRMAMEDVVIKTTKKISTRFGHLLWHSFRVLNQITVDVFSKPQDFELGRALHISLVAGNNLPNRYIAQILTQSTDDPMVTAMTNLELVKTDVVIMARGDAQDNNSPDFKSKINGAVCRSLKELMVKRVAPGCISAELGRIALQYFSIG